MTLAVCCTIMIECEGQTGVTCAVGSTKVKTVIERNSTRTDTETRDTENSL